MPEISRFYGIRITMYPDDHAPPHFHAEYGGWTATVFIENSEIQRGTLPHRAYRMVRSWTEVHREELLENWNLASMNHPLNKIEPLE